MSILDSKSFVSIVHISAGNDHNISNSLQNQGMKEEVNIYKYEDALEAQLKINKIFGKIEIKAEFVNLHKLGSYDKFKAHADKPRVTFAEVKNNWDARLILARAETNRDVLEKDCIYIRRALTRDEILRENAFMKEPREFLYSGVARENPKYFNFVLYNGYVVVHLAEQK